ncbi:MULTISPECIES: STAS domain-containing protein [Thermomonospora]|uniref:Anti-sigma factor antagonist n=1 Tax=Thermomonospora cellulosilytica TaxID=1411118 RepID=A0A7W3N2L3_9ACTN|nr:MULTISPECIES: STAS domain-containing protein [Thermomonospora]MBA9006411.1 anti-anti-sigma factor [Thermomonospora cellulosilytica]
MTFRKELDFSVAVLRHQDRAVVYVAGDIDLHTNGHLRQALTGLIEERASQVIVDLREVGFFGSDALRVLADAQAAAEAADVSLTLAAVPPGVLRIMEITGMDGAFRIRPAWA